MDYHIVEARYVAGHVVWLRFRDGTSGEIDLAPLSAAPSSNAIPPYSVSSRFIPSFTRSSGRMEPTLPPSSCAITCALSYNRQVEATRQQAPVKNIGRATGRTL